MTSVVQMEKATKSIALFAKSEQKNRVWRKSVSSLNHLVREGIFFLFCTIHSLYKDSIFVSLSLDSGYLL